MTLAAAQGSSLELSFDGSDEEAMANAMTEYFAKGFEEM